MRAKGVGLVLAMMIGVGHLEAQTGMQERVATMPVLQKSDIEVVTPVSSVATDTHEKVFAGEDLDAVAALLKSGVSPNTQLDTRTFLWIADDRDANGQQTHARENIVTACVEYCLRELPDKPTTKEIRAAISQFVANKVTKMECTSVRLFQVYPDTTVARSVRVRCDVAAYDRVAMYEVVKASGNKIRESSDDLLTHTTLVPAPNIDFLVSRKTASGQWIADTCEAYAKQRRDIAAQLANGGDPNMRVEDLGNNPYAIVVALGTGDEKLALSILNHKAFVLPSSAETKLPLVYLASMRGCKKCVELLVAKGCSVSSVNPNDGATALYAAAQNGHVGIVEYLLAKGAGIDEANESGITPLMISCLAGNPQVVAVLLKRGAHVNLESSDGETALKQAAEGGWVSCVDKLLAVKADIDRSNKMGFTPLHAASANGSLAVVKALVEHGADISKTSADGLTALTLAINNENRDVASYLKGVLLKTNANKAPKAMQ